MDMSYLENLSLDSLTGERIVLLDALVNAIDLSLDEYGAAHIIFICTHNSRRSVYAECLAYMNAHNYHREGIYTYSAGTEQTQVYPSVIKSLKEIGFKVIWSDDTGPTIISLDEGSEPKSLFSKTLKSRTLPKKNFIAVMTCDHADQNCPFVPGAWKRIALPYIDPKRSDGTESESRIYNETRDLIAREMKYVFQEIVGSTA